MMKPAEEAALYAQIEAGVGTDLKQLAELTVRVKDEVRTCSFNSCGLAGSVRGAHARMFT